MRELENDAGSPTPAQAPASNEASPTADAAINHTSVILAALTRLGPTSLSELQGVTGLPFSEFTDAVRALLDAGVIELEGPSGQEVARLAPPLAAVAGG